MNNKESIRRTQLYLEGLENAIAQPIPGMSAKELDEIINDPEGNEEYQAVICLWKEVIAPLDVAIAFIYNNRVLPQYKEQIVNDESEMPFVQPDVLLASSFPCCESAPAKGKNCLTASSVATRKASYPCWRRPIATPRPWLAFAPTAWMIRRPD